VLVASLTGVGREHPLSREKLSPILAFYIEDGWEACCLRVLELLRHGGLGHTMAIHSRDNEIIMKFAFTKPVFRICVNTPASVGAVGLTTGLEPSMTLGCGALGGNITSDNIMPRHLINLKRLAFETRPFAGSLSPTVEPLPLPGQKLVALQPEMRPVPDDRVRSLITGALERRETRAARTSGAGVTAPHQNERSRPDAGGTGAVAFVSEADVRQAVAENRRIVVGPRTIITPSARDLGREHRVFRES